MTKEGHVDNIDILSPRDILHSGEKTQRLEMISVNRVVQEEVSLDEEHIKELADNMKSGRGQLCPILVRARLENGSVYYDIIDGFHRVPGFSMAGIDQAEAKVLYGCDDEEMYDLRVIAANSVRSVKYARIAKWMEWSFKQTPWAERGFKMSQIFNLTWQDSSGKNLGFTIEEANEVKQWAKEKARKWRKPVSTLAQDIMIIENSSPSLIQKVRTYSGGAMGKNYLNPARLKVIVKVLGTDYSLQEKAADIALKHNLNTRKLFEVTKSLKISKGDKAVYTELLEDPVRVSEELLKKNFRENRALNNKHPMFLPRSRFKMPQINNEGHSSFSGYSSKVEMGKQIDALKNFINTLKKTSNVENNDGRFWIYLSDISPLEKQVMDYLLVDLYDFDVISQELQIPERKIIQCVRSVFAKKRIEETDKNFYKELKSIGRKSS